jgi:hypothetical protein
MPGGSGTGYGIALLINFKEDFGNIIVLIYDKNIQ